MDLTPLIPCNNFSSAPCDLYIATVYLQSRLIIRSTNSLSIKRVINLEPTFARDVTCLKWSRSADGHRRLLIADNKSVKAYDMEDEQWELSIAEGLGGVRHVEWSKQGSEILIWSDFQLKMTAWSIDHARGSIIPNPKFTNRGYAERPGDQCRHFAILQRTSHDQVAILDTTGPDWEIVKTFPMATSDAQGLSWSPDGKWLAVWDNVIDYRVLIYTFDGRLLRTYQAYTTGLGVKSLQWSPSGEYLAIGSYDNKVRLLDNMTFSPVIELSHLLTIRSEDTTVWRQVSSDAVSKYSVADQPISPPFVKANSNEVNVKSGIGILLFSPDGSFLATRSDNMPTTLWIWSLREMSPIAILIQTNNIKSVQWHPHEAGQLIFCCQANGGRNSNAIYLWNIDWEEPRVISIPREGFEVKWFKIIENDTENEVENGIVIGSGDCFTIGYPYSTATTQNTIMEEEEEDAERERNEAGSHDSLQDSIIIHEIQT